MSTALTRYLAQVPVASPLPFALNHAPCLALQLAAANPAMQELDTGDTPAFCAWMNAQLAASGARYAAGGYGEDRALYRMSGVFTGSEEPRTLHLGIDLWLAAQTSVHCVLGGTVHSLQDNARFGDYGPTVILQHEGPTGPFWTLYGHLARATLAHLAPGQTLATGALLGWLGEPEENVGWPPHLHFQIITDLLGNVGDYPGVCRPSESAEWLARCPDPNLLLRIAALGPR